MFVTGDLLLFAFAVLRRKHALVPLLGLLFRRLISRQQSSPSRQRSLRSCLPEPVRVPARRRFVLGDDPCSLGIFQPLRRLPAHLSRRRLQSAQDATRTRPRSRNPDHVDNASPLLRTLPRRLVSAPVLRYIHGRAREVLFLVH